MGRNPLKFSLFGSKSKFQPAPYRKVVVRFFLLLKTTRFDNVLCGKKYNKPTLGGINMTKTKPLVVGNFSESKGITLQAGQSFEIPNNNISGDRFVLIAERGSVKIIEEKTKENGEKTRLHTMSLTTGQYSIVHSGNNVIADRSSTITVTRIATYKG